MAETNQVSGAQAQVTPPATVQPPSVAVPTSLPGVAKGSRVLDSYQPSAKSSEAELKRIEKGIKEIEGKGERAAAQHSPGVGEAVAVGLFPDELILSLPKMFKQMGERAKVVQPDGSRNIPTAVDGVVGLANWAVRLPGLAVKDLYQLAEVAAIGKKVPAPQPGEIKEAEALPEARVTLDRLVDRGVISAAQSGSVFDAEVNGKFSVQSVGVIERMTPEGQREFVGRAHLTPQSGPYLEALRTNAPQIYLAIDAYLLEREDLAAAAAVADARTKLEKNRGTGK